MGRRLCIGIGCCEIMKRLTSTMAGQLILLFVSTVVISQFVIGLAFFIKTDQRLAEFEEVELIQEVISTYKKVILLPENSQQKFIELSNDVEVSISLSKSPIVNKLVEPGNPYFSILDRELGQKTVYMREVQNTWSDGLRFWFTDNVADCGKLAMTDTNCPHLMFSIPLTDSQWLNIRTENGPNELIILMPIFVSSLFILLVIIIVTVFVLKRITQPLEALSEAAEKLGRGDNVHELAVKGPQELTKLTETFNTMQQRLTRFVQDRTRMLVAVSHDLRTPITSLRLRTEFVDDAELKQKMIQTLEDMQTMVEATLAFARHENTVEKMVEVDLAVTLQSVIDEFSDAEFRSKSKTHRYNCEAVSFKRAIRNLIDNAVTYGKQAYVYLDVQQSNVLITIQDFGPGIPENRLSDVFEPFVRLDEARNTENGNVGLGLSIARTFIHKLGGSVTALNTYPGLRVEISLPK